MTLRADDVPADILLRTVAAQIEVPIVFAEGLQYAASRDRQWLHPALTGSFAQIRARHLVGWLAHLAGVKATVRDGAIHILPGSNPIPADPVFACWREPTGPWRQEMLASDVVWEKGVTASLKGPPMRDFLRMMLRVQGVHILLDPALRHEFRAMSTPIVLDVEDRPYPEVLDAGLKQAGLTWRWQGGLAFVTTRGARRVAGWRLSVPRAGLDLTGTRIRNIVALKGSALSKLCLAKTALTDLAPLHGMPLTHLDIADTPVTDLAPLRGLPLRTLLMPNTRVRDLAPLAGMPLHTLDVSDTDVANLRPLRGMGVICLSVSGSQVGDLRPLRDLKLDELWFSPGRITTGLDVVRQSKSLTTINGVKPAEFWKAYEAGVAPEKGLTGPRQLRGF